MPYNDFKSHKKPGHHPLFRRYNLQETTRGGGVKLTPPPTEAVLELIKTDIEIKNKNNLKWRKNKNRKPCKKPITKPNLQDALDFAVNDLETVDYNNDTRPIDLDDLETVDYNNDTSITDLVLMKKIEIIKEEDDQEDGLQIIKTVNYATITNENYDVKFIKKTPLHPREMRKGLSKKNLIRDQTGKKNNFSSNITSKKANTKKIKTKVKTLNILKKFNYIHVNV